ncbi:efflux RND transporter periplasmic adaptor subunit [Niabella beijingensis]|uniref:efflux RND transporter periplasmic adaptor subunit n=1 Tax=Niabella beijingensis TaxID=2872700 RepID=UPI001CBA801F|nr:efflux RND transporter periplasmic adaptor subunit [Niabella beijingensis]MBZ4188914.1 efflux RND transporter periplasmic adaptor subunit [Niabella beijingensis]
MKRNIKLKWWLTCIVFTALWISSCGNKKSSENASDQKKTETHDESIVELNQGQYQTAGIILGSPQKRPLSGILKVNGYIDVPPQNLVSITTQMGGIVKSTPLLQGSQVRKGQVIAVLENQEYVQMQQDYLESKNQLELADSEFKRQQALAEQNVNSAKILQQAKTNYQSRLVQVSALKEKLQLININTEKLSAATIRSRIEIYSPITGYVTKVNVNSGKFVNPNDVMFEIVNASNLHVELNVFEKDASKIKPGQKVHFTLTNDTTDRTAKVQLVGKEINPDKTITVHTIADGTSGHFIPGTYVKAFIETGSTEVLSLPEEAVVDFEGKQYIFINADSSGNTPERSDTVNKKSPNQEQVHRFQMVPVEVGISDAGFIEIRTQEGLDVTGKVVLKGAYDLLSKMKNSEEEE